MENIGNYRIVRKLGEGGMGVVYEGMNDQISRRVAIKVLHAEVCRNQELLARFYTEARATNLASHVGIVDVYELGQLPDGRAYIVMQFLHGDSLADRLQKSGGRIPYPDALRLLKQVASAMESAHMHGILHRDLKPDNIMIVPDSEAKGGERAKIVDFGIAKMLTPEDHPGERPKTRMGTVLGTPAYMAPEQCRGSEGLTDKVDVYALGVILYECLAGRTPFVATGTGEMLAKQLYEQPQPLWELDPTLPADVVTLVQEMLHKSPESRPSMAVLAQRLSALMAQSDASHAQAPGTSPRSPGRRTESLTPDTLPVKLANPVTPATHSLRWGIAGLLVVGLLGLAAYRFMSADRRSSARPDTQPVYQPERRSQSASASDAGAPLVRVPIVHWSIVTEPSGAQVFSVDSQAILGTTPWRLERATSRGRTKLILRLAGYKEHELVFVEDASEARRVTLIPVEALQPTTPEVAKTPSKLKKVRRPTKAAQDFTDAEVKVVE